MTETKEEDDLDEYGRNVNEDESSIWDLFKDNVPKSKESNLWDDNDYNKYKQKFLKKYPNSTEDDFKKQIQGSDYYSKEGWEVQEELYHQLLDGEIGWHELTPEMKSDINNYIEKNNLSVESKSSEFKTRNRYRIYTDTAVYMYDEDDLQEAIEDREKIKIKHGLSSLPKIMDKWNDTELQLGESKSTEGGYGSGKNRHGFGHKKWMKDAETNNSVIDSENMNRDAVPLEEYTYHSRKETDHHKSNPELRRLKDQIRKLERQLDDE